MQKSDPTQLALAVSAPAPKPAAVNIVAPVKAGPPVPDDVAPLLVTILSWRRKHGTHSEARFNDWLEAYIKLNAKAASVTRMSKLDNIVATMPRADGKASDVLFSCHVDTQDHTVTGTLQCTSNGLRQKVLYDANFGHLMLDTKDAGAGGCLGADDGIGVWIMLEMLTAGVPGTYVFHRGEEVGGLGANAMLSECKDFLATHDMAVAFDRPDTDEVIVTQGGSVCASDKFGHALAAQLNGLNPAFDYKISRNGVFTDTKVYRGVIAECVNIGVGYWGQHGTKETQDYGHALALKDACLSLGWDGLPIDRDPATAANEYNGSRKGQSWYGGRGDDWWKDDGMYNDYYRNRTASPAPAPKPASKPMQAQVELSWRDELDGLTMDDLIAMAQDNPDDFAQLVVELMTALAGAEAQVDKLRSLVGLR